MTTLEKRFTIDYCTVSNHFQYLILGGIYAGFFLKFYLEDDAIISDSSLIGRCITLGLITSCIIVIFFNKGNFTSNC